MTRIILKGLGVFLKPVDLDFELTWINSDSLFPLINKHRTERPNGWLQYVGYVKNSETIKVDKIEPTEKIVSEIQGRIDLLRKKE